MEEIEQYIQKLEPQDQEIARLLFQIINEELPKAEAKVWHAHPVWFIEGNPIVGFSKLKNCMRLLFWSGQTFDENLEPEGKFKAAEKRYVSIQEIVPEDLVRWLKKAEEIQWDYKNIVKRKGQLLRLK